MPDEKLTPKKMTDAPQIVEMDIAHSDSVAQLQIMAEANGKRADDVYGCQRSAAACELWLEP